MLFILIGKLRGDTDKSGIIESHKFLKAEIILHNEFRRIHTNIAEVSRRIAGIAVKFLLTLRIALYKAVVGANLKSGLVGVGFKKGVIVKTSKIACILK